MLAAFLVGLLGGVHCVGMCGGVVGALTFGLPEEVRMSTRRSMPFVLAYNIGRIASYSLAGALMGGVGWLVLRLAVVREAQLVLQIVSGLFMIALGLYLAGWWLGLTRLEQFGGRLWRRVEPLGRGLLPISRVRQALALGALWGWLPCGLVYSVLIWSIATGNVWEGAALMLSFGLGTLPNLLALGLLAGQLSRLARRPWVKALAGGLVIAFGAYTLGLAVMALGAWA
jgi:sulfite exporter TauE/SafE